MDLWPEIEELKTIEGAKKIIEQQGEFLTKKTNNMLYLSIEEATNGFYDFCFDVKMRSRYLEKYSYRLLQLNYNILMYPVDIYISKSATTRDELSQEGYTSESNYIKIHDEDDLKRFLKLLFNTDEIKTVISSLLTLSK